MIKAIFILTLIFSFPEQSGYINDYADLFTAEEELSLENRIKELERKTPAEYVVVTVESLGGMTVKDYAVELGNDWAVGHFNNMGVVILISKLEQEVFIATTDGVDEKLSSNQIQKIVDQHVLQEMKQGNFAKGALIALDKIYPSLIRKEKSRNNNELQPVPIPVIIGVIALFIFLMFRFKKRQEELNIKRRPWRSYGHGSSSFDGGGFGGSGAGGSFGGGDGGSDSSD